jgi:YgiT-type zinc finger domain-containing protein
MNAMKNHKSSYEYGHCHICGGKMREKQIKQEFWIKGKLIVIEDVPAGVCSLCGEKVVKAEVGRQIAALIEDSKRRRKTRTMSVPVVRFSKQIA